MIDYERLLTTLVAAEARFVIVGGVAATIHGSSRLTSDLDLVYSRDRHDLSRLVEALTPLRPYLRGAPPGLPFVFDLPTILGGLNFTLTTDAGPLDLLGEMAGVGGFAETSADSFAVLLFGAECRCASLETLLRAKRAAGRPKDLEVIAELEALRSAPHQER